MLHREAAPLEGIEAVWARTRGSPRVRVAVLDGPADLTHPCFAGARIRVLQVDAPTACGASACGHGTHVASLIFAQHGAGGLRGIAPRCSGLLIPIFRDAPGAGVVPCTQRALARAIHAAIDAGANVINLSAGQPGAPDRADPALASAVARCRERGVLLVCSAGNDGCACPHVPASFPGVIAVGASSGVDAPAQFSNFSRLYADHGVVAPGESLAGAAPGGREERRSGTSFATPLVAGLAGLLFSELLERGRPPGTRAAESVRNALLNSTRPCTSDAATCRRLLRGLVDPAQAIKLISKGDLNMSDPTVLDADPRQPTETAIAAGAGVEPACAGKPNCSCGCGSPPAAKAHQEDEDEGVEESAAPPVVARIPTRRPRPAVNPSGCGCGGGREIVYVLGELGYDFGTQARHDAFNAEMDEGKFPGVPRDLYEHVTAKGNQHLAGSVIWTLNHDATPIYAVRPDGPFAREAYERLLEFYKEQLDSKAERVSIPGVTDGSVTLLSGQAVPVVVPDLRGMYNWTTKALVAAVCGGKPDSEAKRKDWEAKSEGVRGFLEKIYFEVRNTGRTPSERALNFAATNAFNLELVFESAAKKDLQLDEIAVEPSPICRPDSDCWDVRIIFFNPADAMGTARTAYRFTVDVSDVVPVLVGPMRTWAVR